MHIFYENLGCFEFWVEWGLPTKQVAYCAHVHQCICAKKTVQQQFLSRYMSPDDMFNAMSQSHTAQFYTNLVQWESSRTACGCIGSALSSLVQAWYSVLTISCHYEDIINTKDSKSVCYQFSMNEFGSRHQYEKASSNQSQLDYIYLVRVPCYSKSDVRHLSTSSPKIFLMK